MRVSVWAVDTHEYGNFSTEFIIAHSVSLYACPNDQQVSHSQIVFDTHCSFSTYIFEVCKIYVLTIKIHMNFFGQQIVAITTNRYGRMTPK